MRPLRPRAQRRRSLLCAVESSPPRAGRAGSFAHLRVRGAGGAIESRARLRADQRYPAPTVPATGKQTVVDQDPPQIVDSRWRVASLEWRAWRRRRQTGSIERADAPD